MTNFIQAELFKLNRNKTFYVLIFTVIGISALVHYLRMSGWWHMSGTAFDRAGLHELNGLSTFTIPLYFNFIVSPLAGFFIANEFSDSGVIKNQVISGSKRSAIFISKFLVFSLGSVIVTIVIPLFIALTMMFLFGHGEILTASNLMYLGRAFSLFALQFLSFTAIVLWIAMITEDSGKTIIITFVLSFIMFVVEKFIPASMIKSLYELTFFYQFTAVFNFELTTGEIVQSVLIGIISLTVILLCGMFTFNRKEIH